jgi:hypothetical protein
MAYVVHINRRFGLSGRYQPPLYPFSGHPEPTRISIYEKSFANIFFEIFPYKSRGAKAV